MHLSQRKCVWPVNIFDFTVFPRFPMSPSVTFGLKLCWHRLSVWLMSKWWHHPGNYWKLQAFFRKHNMVALQLCDSPQEQYIASHVERPQLFYYQNKIYQCTKKKVLSLYHYFLETLADLEKQIISLYTLKRKTLLLRFLKQSRMNHQSPHAFILIVS